MKPQILLPPAEMRRIVREFKTSENELPRALKFERNSPRAQMLRSVALERGGLFYTGVPAPAGYVPNVETDFRNGEMIQTFGNRVQLVVDMKTNRADIIIDGAKVASFDDMTLNSWGSVVYSLNCIYNQLISKKS